jgi:hypothetical protein
MRKHFLSENFAIDHLIIVRLLFIVFFLNNYNKNKKGLVDFVDNWPWTSIVHGQLNFYLISWTLSIKHGKFFQKIFLLNFNAIMNFP